MSNSKLGISRLGIVTALLRRGNRWSCRIVVIVKKDRRKGDTTSRNCHWPAPRQILFPCLTIG